MRKTRTWLAAAIVAVPCMTPAAMAAEAVKIGFVATFSGPAAAIGNDMRYGFNLGLEHLGHRMAGKPVEVVYEDDTQTPEVGKQKTDKLIESDHVNFLTGYGFSNVLLASLLPAVNAQTFIISANAGPSQIAGEQCSPYFFSVSWQGDQAAQATGEYLNQKGVKTLFLIDPNYAAGKDVASGVKANFKGQVVGEEYTAWPGQLDFSAELTKARAAKPDAIFAFYPGAAGAQFLTSPGLEVELVEFAAKSGVLVLPGALTPTEVLAAWKAGGDMVKVYPCSQVGGAKYIRSLKGPYPKIPLIASGGVGQQTAADFFARAPWRSAWAGI